MTHPSLTPEQVVRDVLTRVGRLSVDATTVEPDTDLFDVGMNSHASVNVMVELEDALEIEFPDAMLRRSTFTTVANIVDALDRMGVSSEVQDEQSPVTASESV